MLVGIQACTQFLFLTAVFVTDASDSAVDEARLVRDLMADYSPHVRPRPAAGAGGPLIVDVGFMLGRVENLNEKDQIMSTFGWILMSWTDSSLTWQPELYGGVTDIVLPEALVWRPEVLMENSVSEGGDLSQDIKTRVRISSTGQVRWWPGFALHTPCSFNLTYYPFDQHICYVWFLSTSYNPKELVFRASSTQLDVRHNRENLAWKLVNHIFHGTFDPRLPSFGFKLVLRRNPTFQTWQLVLPALLMTLTSLLVFALPAESGEKIGLAITILLGYSVFLLMISDSIPQSGEHLPLISQYIVVSMIITGLSLVVTVATLSLHHHPQTHDMPRWLHTALLKGVATLLRMRRSDLDLTDTNDVKPMTADAMGEKPPATPSSIADPCPLNGARWEHAGRITERLALIVFAVGIAAVFLVYMVPLVRAHADHSDNLSVLGTGTNE